MPEEINEGIAYLRALKQAAASEAASAAAPAQEANRNSQAASPGAGGNPFAPEPFKGAEKRRSPRYKCEGSAELCEAGCDVRTWAAFTDISMGGCYVEAQATYPVGTKLHMKLQANGFKVETMGSVRVNYPYLGMGIAFEDTSEENRAYLKELLSSISRPCGIMGPGIASAVPAAGPLGEVPPISHPEAAIRALLDFFETHQMLMREDFLKILRASQSSRTTP